MTEEDIKPVECEDCGEVPQLCETPYEEDTGYIVTCDCDMRRVDVSDAMEGKSLVEPMTGKWSNINYNTRTLSNDDV